MRKLALLAGMLAMVIVAAVPAVAQVSEGIGQESESGDVVTKSVVTNTGENVNQEVSVKAEVGPKTEAKAGGAEAKAAPAPEAKAGGAEAKAEAPKAEAKALPKTGGSGAASLAVLGAGGLLVAGGLMVRRVVR